jgi:hypothetical protein
LPDQMRWYNRVVFSLTFAPSKDSAELQEILRTKSVKFGNFTLASGQVSDVYVDCRPTTCDPRAMRLIGGCFCARWKNRGGFQPPSGLDHGRRSDSFRYPRRRMHHR